MKWPNRAATAEILSAIAALDHRLSHHEATMTTATNNLSAKIDDLTSAVTDALTEMESEVATIKSKSAVTDDSDEVNASASRISTLSQTIRDAMSKVKGEIAAVPANAGGLPPSGAIAPGATPGTASTAPAVALAGVPETPASTAGLASTGPAVPSTDPALTDASPNQDTSSPAPEPSPATAAVSGT